MTLNPERFVELWLSTAALALTSSVVALAIAVPVGYWLAGLSPAMRRLAQSTLLVPFLLPPFLVGGFLVAAIGRDTAIESAWLWIVIAHAFMNVGFLAMVIAGGLEAIEAELVETAQVAGAGRWQIFRWVELPLLSRSIAGAALLVAIYSSTSYGLVLLLGGGSVRTLETALSQAALQRLALDEAGILAIGQLLLSLVMVAFVMRVGRGDTPPLFGGLAVVSRGRRATGGSAALSSRIIGLAVFTAVAAVLMLLVLGALRSGGNWQAGGDWTLANFANLSGRGGRDILNLTLLEAAGNSLRNVSIALLLALPTAWWLARPGRKFTALSVMPLGVSPVVLGLVGLVAVGQLSRLGLPFQTQWLLLPIFQALLVIPVLLQLLTPARAALDPAVLEAAKLDGAGRYQITRYISGPLLRRPLASALAIGGLAVLGEFGAASFMSFGSQATLSVALARLLSHPGAENLGMFSAAAAVFVTLTWLLLWTLSQTDASRPNAARSWLRAR